MKRTSVNLHVGLHECEIFALILREEHRANAFENKYLRLEGKK
jgi:hypothetical protein